ncbi:nitric oxide reductase transcription regulator, partial [Pseudomonas syringae pv. tagetis]
MMTLLLLGELIRLVADLSRELPDEERFRRLLRSLHHWLPCEAAAQLRHDGEVLLPLAVDRLSHDTIG